MMSTMWTVEKVTHSEVKNTGDQRKHLKSRFLLQGIKCCLESQPSVCLCFLRTEGSLELSGWRIHLEQV